MTTPATSIHPHFLPANAAALDRALSGPGVFATDADGTLWRDDIGEAFLRQLIADDVLVWPEARGIDVWGTYEAKVKVDKLDGYGWAVRTMAGLREDDVRARAEAFAREFVPTHVFPAMKALLAEADRRGCTPWIVSASNAWIIRAAAPLVGLPPERGLGVRLRVVDGVLTDELEQPVTFRAGKVAAIDQFIGRRPSLAAGDSSGDLELLACAEGAALFIEHPGRTPADLVAHARDQRWLVQSFAP